MTWVAGAPSALKAGDSIGGYLLTSQVGCGPSSHAFRGEDSARKQVVVRVLRSELAAAADWVEHFITASLAQRSIEHPCLARVLAADVRDSVPYAAEEFLGERSLIYLLFNEGIRQDQAIAILFAMADLAAACHSVDPPIRLTGVRPTDVFQREDGSVRVCHAGVLKTPLIEAPPGPARTSVPPNQCFAPEIVAGGQPTVQSDIYSLGLVFLRVLRGNRGTAEAIRGLSQGIDIRKALADLEGTKIDDTLRRCLMSRPEDRFGSTDELLDWTEALMPKAPPRGPRFAGVVLEPAPFPVPAVAPAKAASPIVEPAPAVTAPREVTPLTPSVEEQQPEGPLPGAAESEPDAEPLAGSPKRRRLPGQFSRAPSEQ